MHSKRDLLSLLNHDILKDRLVSITETNEGIAPLSNANINAITLPTHSDTKINDVSKEIGFKEYDTNVLPDIQLPKELRESKLFDNLSQIYHLILNDVRSSRERLSRLNPSRRKLIERRLEFIARKIASQTGKKLNQTFDLQEILKGKEFTNSILRDAWFTFQAEVALYNIFELFFLKKLEFHGLRKFDNEDLNKLNFSSHQYLSQHAIGFSKDTSCWNFVRNNLYSWFVLQDGTDEKILEFLNKIENESPLAWSDLDLINWVQYLHETENMQFFNFHLEMIVSKGLVDFFKQHAGIELTRMQGNIHTSAKILFPSLGRGGFALNIMDELLEKMNHEISADEKNITQDTLQLQNSIFACEIECFELSWVEVMSLLKTISKTSTDRAIPSYQYAYAEMQDYYKIPHVLRSVNKLALELHNVDQLPLLGSGMSGLLSGSAGHIQQNETFDLSIVTDCPYNTRSSQYLSAISEQIPYWKKLIKGTSNVNWGELHTYLSISKLKDGGKCILLTHKPFAQGKDCEKLRKLFFKNAHLESVFEIAQTDIVPIKYIYVFTKKQSTQRPSILEFKKCKIRDIFSLKIIKEEMWKTHIQTLIEQGWNEGTPLNMPFITEHLSSSTPRLGQHATIIVENNKSENQSDSEFAYATKKQDDSIFVIKNSKSYTFTLNLCESDRINTCIRIIPHDSNNKDWLTQYLNSNLVQKYIKHFHHTNLEISDLKALPILNFNKMNTNKVDDCFEWISQFKGNHKALLLWAKEDVSLNNRWSRLLAIVRKLVGLDKINKRYGCLLEVQNEKNLNGFELKPENVTQFYPERLLVSLNQHKEIRIKTYLSECTSVQLNDWVIVDSCVNTQNNKTNIVLKTKQGPSIVIDVPFGTDKYICAQILKFKSYTWKELQVLIKVPLDSNLFLIQVSEISRILKETKEEQEAYQTAFEHIAQEIYLENATRINS